MQKSRRKILLLIIAILLLAIVGIYFLITYQSYNYIQILETHENKNTDNANYTHCLEGVLRYSRDGVALLSEDGKEIWNQSIQMGTPIVECNGESVAIGDKGGTSIFVFQKKGLKGEIQTAKPIEKLAVSSQGIVSAILKDEETPLVMCYDAKGNILVEHKSSVKGTGYPIGVAISDDGKTLLVSYLHIDGTDIVTKVSYYYFGTDAGDENHQIKSEEFVDAVIPTMAFLDHEVSLLVSDRELILYEGLKQPKQVANIELKNEIQSVAYDKETIALLLKNKKGTGYELHTYNTKGELLASVNLKREYANIKVEEKQVILYDGQLCSIYMKNGIHKYTGKMDSKISDVFPINGLNRYMVINTGGFQEVKLVK